MGMAEPPLQSLFPGIGLFNMPVPDIFRRLDFQQCFRERLSAVPEMIFRISAEWNDDISCIVDIRGAVIVHVFNAPYLFITDKTGVDYIANGHQGQREKIHNERRRNRSVNAQRLIC
jgi:hypothetical protein